MLTAAAVLVCALSLIGRPMPPIELLDVRPPDVSANAEAFVRRDPDRIFLLTCTEVFRDAQLRKRDAVRKLASILVHEEWHVKNGADEAGAYHAQLAELLRQGEAPDRYLYRSVWRAMRYVTQTRRPQAASALRR